MQLWREGNVEVTGGWMRSRLWVTLVVLHEEFNGQDQTSDSVTGQQEEESSLKVFQTHLP